MTSSSYPIGHPDTPWGDAEKAAWLSQQGIRRSYTDDVVSVLSEIGPDFDVEPYGALGYQAYGGREYPLFAVRSSNWDEQKPTVLVTGGVHGYETSGVHGALRFLQTKAQQYLPHFNVLVLPCLSPWGYETINRWTPFTVDPNRSFKADSSAQESALAMAYVASVSSKIMAHIDLHETTDSDNSEFRPAKAARDGTVNTNWNIPDGFYLVGDTEQPAADFQQAIIAAVATVTHIADADEQGLLIGEPLAQPGVILYPAKTAGLCAGFTGARYVTTTEVYPDSPKSTPENCILAQVVAVCAGLDFLIGNQAG